MSDDQLLPHHRDELKKSAIASEIVDLNFESIFKADGYYYTLRNGDGTQIYVGNGYENIFSQKLNRSEAWLRLARPDNPDRTVRTEPESNLVKVPDISWRGYTIDYRTFQRSSDFYCTKYDSCDEFGRDLRRFDRAKRKRRKYEHPWKAKTLPILLDPGEAIANLIYERYGVNPTPAEMAKGFWFVVWRYPQIPLFIVEGWKKAAALLSLGYPAIGGSGIWAFYRTQKDKSGKPTGNSYITEGLAKFAKPGREFVFVFDQDEKESTRETVNRAINLTGKLLEAEYHCTTSVVGWSENAKGIDDLIYLFGADIARQRIKQKQPRESWAAHIWQAQIKELEYKGWLSKRSFTPNRAIEPQRFLSTQQIPIPESNTITSIQAGLGQGKTTLIGEYIFIWRSQGYGVHLIGYRNGLLYQTCERWGLEHLHRDKAFARRSDPQSLLAYCVDSLKHFLAHDFKNKILVIDEILSVIIHLIQSSTIKTRDRRKILELFEAAIQNADCIILMDAHLADWVVEYIAKIRAKAIADTEVIKYCNDHPEAPLDIIMLCSTLRVDADGDEVINLNDRSVWLGKIYATAKAFQLGSPGQGFAITSDSQRELAAIDKKLRNDFGLRVVRIDSETTKPANRAKFPEVGEFLLDPKAYIEKHKPHAVLYSPSAESGLDINIKGYFIAQFCLFTGMIGTNSAMQMMMRIRDEKCPRIVLAVTSRFNQDHDGMLSGRAREIQSARADISVEIAKAALEGREPLLNSALDLIKAGRDDLHNVVEFALTSDFNYERTCYRDRLIERLEGKGHQLTRLEKIPIDEADATALAETQEIKQQLEREYATAVYKAKNITDSQAYRIAHSFNQTDEQQHQLKKWELTRRLPGLQAWTGFSPFFVELVLFDDPGLISRIRRRHLLSKPELPKITTAKQFARALQSEGLPLLAELSATHLVTKTLINLGIPELMQHSHRDLHLNHALIQPIAKQLQRKQIRQILKVSKLKKDSDQAIRTIGAMLERTLDLKFTEVKQRGSDGDRTRVYRLDDQTDLANRDENNENLSWKEQKAILLAKARKFIAEATKLEIENNSIEKSAEQILDEIILNKDVEVIPIAVAPTDDNVITNSPDFVEFQNFAKNDHQNSLPPTPDMGFGAHSKRPNNSINNLVAFAVRDDHVDNSPVLGDDIPPKQPAKLPPSLGGGGVVAPASPLAPIERAWQQTEVTELDKLRSRLSELIHAKAPPPERIDATLKIFASRLNDEVLQASDLKSIEWRLNSNLGAKIPVDDALAIWCNLSPPVQEKIAVMVLGEVG
jgi:hypothetical protein